MPCYVVGCVTCHHRYDLIQLPIPVPKGDPQFDPEGTGTKHLPFSRSKAGFIYGTSDAGDPVYEGEDRTGLPRDPINWVSPAIDGSMVYGSEAKVNAILREGVGGRIKMTSNGLPTQHEIGVPVDNPTGDAEERLMRAGDSRINDQPGIVALHALFLREHNRLANSYAKQDPDASDDLIFARARRIVVAELQSITFNEYLPALLGREVPQKQHDGAVDNKDDAAVGKGTPLSVPVEFSTAAFRFGHSQVSDVLWLRGANFSGSAELRLKQSYFAPDLLAAEGAIDDLLRGAAIQRAERIDLRVSDDLRNSLFGTIAGIRTIDTSLSGDAIGGLDLISLNLQRGRDHGIPDYVSVREQLLLPVPTSYRNVTGSLDPDGSGGAEDDEEEQDRAKVAAKMEAVFGPFKRKNLDLFVGGLAEPHRSGASIGETFATIIERTFQSVRAADAGWYQKVLSDEEQTFVEGEMTLSKLIALNTNVDEISAAAVFISRDACASVPDNDYGCRQTTTMTRTTATATSTTATATSTTTTLTTTTATTTATATYTTTTMTTTSTSTMTTSSTTTTSSSLSTPTGTNTRTEQQPQTTVVTKTSAMPANDTGNATTILTTDTSSRTTSTSTFTTFTTVATTASTSASATPAVTIAPGEDACNCSAATAADSASLNANAKGRGTSASGATVSVVVGMLCSILGAAIGMAIGRPAWVEAWIAAHAGNSSRASEHVAENAGESSDGDADNWRRGVATAGGNTVSNASFAPFAQEDDDRCIAAVDAVAERADASNTASRDGVAVRLNPTNGSDGDDSPDENGDGGGSDGSDLDI